jgi:hypothetical protein
MNQLLLLKLKENENKHNANSIMNSANAINQYEKSHSDLLHDSMIVQGPQEIEDIDSNIKYFQDQIDRYSPVNSKKKSWGVLNMFKRRNPNMNNLRSTLKTKLINDGTARSVSNIRKELNTLKKTKENIKSGINYRKKEREKTSDTIDYLSTFNKKIRGATKDLKIT